MKKLLMASLLLTSVSSYADVLSLKNVVSKVEKQAKSEKSNLSSSALNSYNMYKAEDPNDHDQFMEKVSSFREAMSENGNLKTLIKATKKACRKSSETQECRDSISTLTSVTKQHFEVDYENRFFRFGVNELIADRFWFITGSKNWGNSTNGDFIPYTLGLGLQAARSLVNFGICALPLEKHSGYKGAGLEGRWNVGVVASAVVGAGVTSGVYIGGQGICFDFGIMYGVGAYVALTGYNPHAPGAMQLNGDEAEAFPPRL